MLPSTEARIAAQEKFTTMLNARIEQLSQDMEVNFRDLKQEIKDKFTEVKQEIKRIEDGMRASFLQVGDAFNLLDSNIEAIKTTMATKEDLASVKNDIGKLEAGLDGLEVRFDKVETTQDKQDAKLDLILQLLQQKPDK